jgi:hypothetical protein
MPALSLFELDTNRPVVVLPDAAAGLSAAQTIDAIVTMTPTATRVVTSASGADIIAALGGTPTIGTTFELTFVNSAAGQVITFTPNASGCTIVGAAGAVTVAAATSATYIGRVATASTIVFYRK